MSAPVEVQVHVEGAQPNAPLDPSAPTPGMITTSSVPVQTGTSMTSGSSSATSIAQAPPSTQASTVSSTAGQAGFCDVNAPPPSDKDKKKDDPMIDSKMVVDNKKAGKHGEQADKVNQKIAGNAQAKKASEFFSPGFTESFCGCFSSLPGFALSCCCPCIVGAVNEANIAERPITYVDCLVCCPNSYTTRQTLRKKYNMEYKPYNDALAACCCHPCFLHQQTREIARRSGTAPEYFRMV